MKKTILLTIMLLMSVTFTFAQFAEKGSFLFNGSMSFYAGKYITDFGSGTNEVKTTDLSFAPSFQYFVINNLAVGALIQASHGIVKYDGGDKEISTDLLFAPVVRYYVWKALFVQGHYGFGSGKTKYESSNGSSETKVDISNWALVAGWSVRITDTVLFDPMIGYRGDKTKGEGDGSYEYKYKRMCIQLGFTILINK